MEAKIRELHAQGMSCYRMSTELGIPSSSLHRQLTKMGLSVTKNRKVRSDPIKDHADEIIAAYQNGESSLEIAKRYQCDGSSVTRLLKRSGVESRYQYSVDDSFFTNIDTEAKAYTLGFFTADGCLTKQGVMSIRVCDRDVVEKIQVAMKHTGPIRVLPPQKNFPDRQVSYALDIKRPQLEADLIRWGCCPNKSFKTVFPADLINPELRRHFVRGLFDGDGSLKKDTRKSYIFQIAGTAALLGPILSLIRKATNVSGGIYPHSSIFVMNIGGNLQVRRVLDWLYRDCSIYMERKYQLYQEFINGISTSGLHPESCV